VMGVMGVMGDGKDSSQLGSLMDGDKSHIRPDD